MNECNNEYKDWIRLSLVPGIGRDRFFHLVRFFGSPRKVFEASQDELIGIEGIGKWSAEKILKFDSEERLQEEIKKIKKYKVNIQLFNSDLYPQNLKSIYNPPILLYVRGNFFPLDNFSIAIVGTRKASSYGKAVAETLAQQLAKRNITVVSGLAKGIDSYAHLGALKENGRTIAVLGCGVDICYPASNKELMERIVENGAVISEYPMGTPPEAGNFPLRNRIISGISLGVVIVEAGPRSGALITANFALEQGREVFAVPGNIFSSKTKGTHSLIKQGAKLVESVDDILTEIEYLKDFINKIQKTNIYKDKQELNKEEKVLYDLISLGPIHIDKVRNQIKIPFSKLYSLLVTLELKGKIKQQPGKIYYKA